MYIQNTKVSFPMLSFYGAYGFVQASVPNLWGASLFGEKASRQELIFSSILVIAFHLWFASWLLAPAQPELIAAKPLKMEVSMLTVAAPKPTIMPPSPPPPKPPEKVEPVKPKPLPVIKKATPVVKKPAETMPAETVATPPAMQPETQSSAATPSKTVTSPQSTPFTEANFKANYLHNPAPEYPQLARNREWQGNVMLRVKVSSEGLCEGIALETSSGHEMLDDAAMEAVKKWQFVPAKRGEIAEASTVLVPIKFKLTEN